MQWECQVRFWFSAFDSPVIFAVDCWVVVRTSLHQYPCDWAVGVLKQTFIVADTICKVISLPLNFSENVFLFL